MMDVDDKLSAQFWCADCGAVRELQTEHREWRGSGACPECGSQAVHGTATVAEVIRVRDEMKAVGKDASGKTVLRGRIAYERTKSGVLAGTDALVEQFVDKTDTPGTYSKKVTLSDGTVPKDVRGALTDQSLHGPQQSPTAKP